jgi:hypothetical protein
MTYWYMLLKNYISPSISSQPEKSGPVAAVTPSGQQPYLVTLHMSQSSSSHSTHPVSLAPVAAVTTSRQHPNLT